MVLGLLCLGIAACGSSSSSSISTDRSQSTTSAAAENQAAESGSSGSAGSNSGSAGRGDGKSVSKQPVFKPQPHHDSGGGSGQFEAKGGDNSIEEFGEETSGSEFEEAAAALHDYLDARAQRAWAAACRYLAAGVTKELIAQLAQGRGSPAPTCAGLLAGFSTGLPQAVLREAAVADVGSLRVEGDRGFLLYHGAGRAPYFISMAREEGHWKVAAIGPSPAP
ncbi:MAG TPA: hypothetical protein VFN85_01395 [Solirubrobacterales bacterium]|nr:hypothetical protein [Solirubrobacterales bacterium]